MSEVRVDARVPRFFDLYSRGDIEAQTIHDFIARWHADQDAWARDMALQEYLGLTSSEYEVWLYDPQALPYILRARQPGEDLTDIMAERYEQLRRAGRRDDETIVFSLGNWLQRQPRR